MFRYVTQIKITVLHIFRYVTKITGYISLSWWNPIRLSVDCEGTCITSQNAEITVRANYVSRKEGELRVEKSCGP